MLKYRLLNPNVPLRKRVLQGINASVETLLGKALNLAHVLEFPKCGGSWVRNMIRTYRGTDLFSYDRLIRSNDVVMGHRLFHRRFYRPVVVVRDPRDMYVSFYHYENSFELSNQHSSVFAHFRHDPDRPVRDDFLEYLRAKFLYPSHPWFFYSQFLDSWLNRPNVCLVRYEDCLADPEAQLISIVRFLDDPVDLERISATVRETSFAAITKAKYGQSRNAGEEDNSKFHRKGVSGDWKNYFNGESCRLLEKFEGKSLKRLGYETDSHWIDRFMESSKGDKALRSAENVS